ncbi:MULTISPECIES: sensor histidine kinase [unclassified Microbacterium]|uniref:sensor histidine kinase n=1 Tax=unclassified Microbacterium TaxID=2609290 RepID=UPI003019375D
MKRADAAAAARSASTSIVRLLRFEVRDRVATGNQLLLWAIVTLLLLTSIATGALPNPELFALGALGITFAALASLTVPWDQIPPGWAAVVPIVDILAIALLRMSDPAAGLGLLWAFPAMWLGSLGRSGLIASCTVIPAIYWGLLVTGPSQAFSFATLLLPLVIIAISGAGYSSARRFRAQRELLDGQAARLAYARSVAIRQEQLVSEVLDTVDFGVVRLSLGGDIVYENDAAGRLGAAMPGLHAATGATTLLAADGRTPLNADDYPLARARRGETFDDDVAWSVDPDGRRTALTFTARRLVDHRGADSGAVVTARDVTAEREALQARDDLVASVSHELRTPLTSLLGYLELTLDEEDLPERPRRFVDTALGSGERLLEIVSDILSASRRSIKSVESSVHPRETEVVQIVRASILALRPLADDRVLKISRTGPDSVRAFADPARLRQVVDNLVGNAIKFNRDGGSIDIAVDSDGETTTISVRDTGVGVPPEAREHIFERFFRASEDVPGNGLGLALSNEIVKAHGGALTVDSEPGVGSTFTVSIPTHPPIGASR